jgi:hypothetical protein
MRIRTALLVSLFTAFGCGVFDSDDPPPSSPEAEPPASPPPREEEQADPPPPPPLTGTPTENEITEEYGVFVAAAGTADGEGTRAKPLASIQAGIETAKATGKRVYVCGETFKEALTLARGIPMVGGFDCSSAVWKKGTTRTRIESPSSPALDATGIDIPTRIEGFDVVAPDGTAEAPTSIGLRAKKSGGLALVSSSITAGRGFDGAPGTEGIPLTFSQTYPGAGSAEWIQGDYIEAYPYDIPIPQPPNLGGGGAVGSCTGAPGFAGGMGGSGGKGGLFASDHCRTTLDCAVAGYPFYRTVKVLDPISGQMIEVALDPNTPGEPGAGSAAVAGKDGLSAAAPGTFTESGFVPADGTNGTNGTPGKGGAGGAGAPRMKRRASATGLRGQGATGPGGGAGGCPGLAGTAGKGGGASVGALVYDSPGITFDAVEIVAGDGGAGGRGTLGSSATAGGPPATPQGAAEPGQAGQPGGRAGVSGSGAGGSSVAIAHHGGAPSLVNGSTLKVGKPGSGVPQEQKTDPATGQVKLLAASVAGVAKDLLEF